MENSTFIFCSFITLAIALPCAIYVNKCLIAEGTIDAKDYRSILKTIWIAAIIALSVSLIIAVLGLAEAIYPIRTLFFMLALVFGSTTIHNIEAGQTNVLVQVKRLGYHAIFWILAFLFVIAVGNDGETIIWMVSIPILLVISGVENMNTYGGCLLAIAAIYVILAAISLF